MIHHHNSDNSITIEGSKEDLDNLKKKIASLLGIKGPIGDNLYIELQSVFKALRNDQGQPYTISVEEAFKRQNKKPEYTDNCKKFLAALGNKDAQPVDLPKPPIGDLTFEELKNKFGFEKGQKPREYFINIPDELIETCKIVKKAYQPDDKENRFTIKEDEANPKTIIYNFEVISDNKLKLRRFFQDKDDQHFVFTALRLLCFYQSKDSGPILNLFKERAGSYLINCLPKPTDLPYNKIPEFHCELIDKDYGIPPIELFFKNPVRISIDQAIFLIETFCEIQDKQEKCNFSKSFISHKCCYLLSILSPLPVAFEYIGSCAKVELTFADTEIASSDFIFNQVKFAMGIFSKLPLFTARLINVDSIYWPSEKFITINEKLGFSIIRGIDEEIRGKAASFTIYALLNKPIINNDQSQINIIRGECHKIYDEIKLYMCDQCDNLFSYGFGGECVKVQHMGNRIPFPDTGEMEKIEYLQEGDQLIQVKYVNYDCCGEQLENDPGCIENLFPFGHKEKVDDKGNPILYSYYFDGVNIPE